MHPRVGRLYAGDQHVGGRLADRFQLDGRFGRSRRIEELRPQFGDVILLFDRRFVKLDRSQHLEVSLQIVLVGRIDREIDIVAADRPGDALLDAVLVRAEAAVDGIGHRGAFDDRVLELFGSHVRFFGAVEEQADRARFPGHAAAQHNAAS